MRRAEQRKFETHRDVIARRGGTRVEPAFILESVLSLFSEAMHYQQSGQTSQAVALYDRILSLKSNIAEVHCNRGVGLVSLGRLDDAETAYRQAIALNPSFANAYNNLGVVLCEIGKPYDAELAFRAAIKLKPEEPQHHLHLGVALRRQSKFGDAEMAHRQAIALDPGYGDAYINLGDVLRCLGRLNESESVLRHATGLRPQSADAFSKLGNTLGEQGKIGEAVSACRQAVALDPNNGGAYYDLGTALGNQGELIEAAAAYRRAIALNPKFAGAYNDLGTALMYLGRLTEARQAVERAIHLAPQKALYFRNLSEVRSFSPGDPYLAAMEKAAENIFLLPTRQQIEMRFALAKAYDDVNRRNESFQQLLAANALQRKQIEYDETATLAAFKRIREGFTPALMQAFQSVGEPSALPVFIIGMPRSGTTLIEQIVASHPRVFGAGELPNFGNAVEDILGSRPLPGAGNHFRQLGARYVAEISPLAPTATRIVNKTPSNFNFVGFIHLALPNARIIHAVRHPADTCVSCFSKLFAAGQHYTYDLTELGRYYRNYQALMEHWRHVLPPGRILDVHYEDVVADLEGQSRRIIAHCGLEWNARCLAFHETERPVRTASAAQVRQPIYSSAIGRWRAYEPFLQPLLTELRLECAGATSFRQDELSP